MKKNEIKGHSAMLLANGMWGLMSPIAKLVFIGSAVTPFILADFRIIGAAALFWIVSFFTKKEHVPHGDMLKLFFASLLGIVCNQGLFTIGLGMTSPIDASIITTSTPILTMVFAAFYLKEPVTGKKVLGIFTGASGALLLIMSNSGANAGREGNVFGDLLCMLAEASFSLYLVLFKDLISRYSPITLMKWMFTYAMVCIVPFSYTGLISLDWSSISSETIWCIVFVVAGGTFISYLLSPVGQQNLRPTVVSMYCYVQPIVASIVAVCWGMDQFNLLKVIAVCMVFTGVFLVTRSKSRAQMEAYAASRAGQKQSE